MADNKLQHYVPKCHLRPFCHGPERGAINLFNISGARFIKGAPVKGQCASDYFYGEDRVVETMLQEWEGRYATIVRKATEDPASVTKRDLDELREFTLLQTFRTRGHVQKIVDTSKRQRDDIEAAANGRRIDLPPLMPVRVAVDMSINHFLNSRKVVSDLVCALVVNRTRIDFITSDDPAVITNRLFIQRRREDGTGLASAGAMLHLPLTPKLSFLAYDDHVYHAPEKRAHLIETEDRAAISELNELQILNSRHNLYYRDPETREQIGPEWDRYKGGRRDEAVVFRYYRQIADDRVERYEEVDQLKLEQGAAYLTRFSFVRAHPSRWTRLLQFRLRPKWIDTGALMGPLRPSVNIRRPPPAKPIYLRDRR